MANDSAIHLVERSREGGQSAGAVLIVLPTGWSLEFVARAIDVGKASPGWLGSTSHKLSDIVWILIEFFFALEL